MSETMQPAAADFLNRLVDKALGVESAIAPRLQSMFEVAQDAVRIEEQASPEQPQFPAVAAPNATQPDGGAARPRQQAEISELGPLRRDVAPLRIAPHGFMVRSPLRDDVPSASAGLINAAHATLPSTATPAPRRVLPPQQENTPHADLQAPPAAASTPMSDASMRIDFSPVFPSIIEQPSPFSRPADPHMPDAEVQTQATLVPASQSAVEAILLAMPRAARPAPRDERSARPPDTPAEPTVNVTIGRVEVRATPAPIAKPARATHAPRPLGLDEYLNRRADR